jgi:WD40 repeat protein
MRSAPVQLFMNQSLWLANRVKEILFAAGIAVAILPATVEALPASTWMLGGHAARITGVACSPDGTLIASSSEDGTIKLWSTNGTLLRTLTAQLCPVTALAWSPDGAKIAAGGYVSGAAGRGVTYLWQAPSGWTAANVSLALATTNRFGYVTALAFTSDSTRLASGCNGGSNIIYSVADGSVVASCPAYNTSVRPAAVASVAFSSAGMMASGCEDATFRVYSTNSWNLLWSSSTAHTSNVTAVAFSPDGAWLATASLDQTVKVWSTANWNLQQTLVESNAVGSVAFSPDGQEIISGSVDGTISMWNWSGGNCVWTIAAHALPVTATVFTPDGSRVISGSDDRTVRVWSAADGSAVGTAGSRNNFLGAVALSPDGTLCENAISAVGFSPDGTLCASVRGAGAADANSPIRVCNTSDGSLVQTLAANTNYVSRLAFSPDSTTLASGGGPLDPTIKLWRISDGALVQSIPATTNGVMALAWSPDGTTLAAGGDSMEQNITFWSTNGVLQGTVPGTVSGFTPGVTALAFSPQSNLLAAGGRRPKNAVEIWTNSMGGIWTTGIIAQMFLSPSPSNNVECVTFSPDGQLVAWGMNGQNVLNIGSIASGASTTLGSSTNPVFSAAFSTDGTALAATGQNTIEIWTNGASWSSWALCGTVTNEAIRACRLAFSPNGNLLLCGREDGTITMSTNNLGALGQPPLVFKSITARPPAPVVLNAMVQPRTHYVIQSSANLSDWRFLTLGVSDTNVLSIADSTTLDAPLRFYRAITPP